MDVQLVGQQREAMVLQELLLLLLEGSAEVRIQQLGMRAKSNESGLFSIAKYIFFKWNPLYWDIGILVAFM